MRKKENFANKTAFAPYTARGLLTERGMSDKIYDI